MPDANPCKDKGELAKSFRSVIHRNLLGIALNQKGEIWAHEMGPKNGDELNSILYRAHYGSPIVSEGIHYSVAGYLSARYRIPTFTPRPHPLFQFYILPLGQ